MNNLWDIVSGWYCDVAPKVSADFIGGMTLFVGAAFYCLNIHDAWVAQSVVGVSLYWSAFFVLLNVIYCYIFFTSNLRWSFIGSTALAITELVYFIEILTLGV